MNQTLARPDRLHQVLVGQPKSLVPQGIPDLTDLTDQKQGGEGAEKKMALSGLLGKLQQQKEGTESVSRHVLTPPSETFISDPPILDPVGQVGNVGQANKNSNLQGFEVGQAGRSGRSPPLPDQLVGQGSADAWGLTSEERARGLERLRGDLASDVGQVGQDDLDGPDAIDPDDYPMQSIGQAEMVAGLLQAARQHVSTPHSVSAPPPLPTKICGALLSRRSNASDDPWQEGVYRLLETPPPADGFTPHRWRRLVLDCVYLFETWAPEIRRLGWNAEDAFGLHPIAPGINVSASGLGPLLNGAIVVTVTEKGATMKTKSGAALSFTRRPMAGAIPAWEIGQNKKDQPNERH